MYDVVFDEKCCGQCKLAEFKKGIGDLTSVFSIAFNASIYSPHGKPEWYVSSKQPSSTELYCYRQLAREEQRVSSELTALIKKVCNSSQFQNYADTSNIEDYTHYVSRLVVAPHSFEASPHPHEYVSDLSEMMRYSHQHPEAYGWWHMQMWAKYKGLEKWNSSIHKIQAELSKCARGKADITYLYSPNNQPSDSIAAVKRTTTITLQALANLNPNTLKKGPELPRHWFIELTLLLWFFVSDKSVDDPSKRRKASELKLISAFLFEIATTVLSVADPKQRTLIAHLLFGRRPRGRDLEAEARYLTDRSPIPGDDEKIRALRINLYNNVKSVLSKGRIGRDLKHAIRMRYEHELFLQRPEGGVKVSRTNSLWTFDHLLNLGFRRAFMAIYREES